MKKTVLMKNCTAQFHPTFNNSKLGGKKLNLLAISYVPGNNVTLKNGQLVSDCKGTCSAIDCTHCEKACYAIRSYKQYPTVTKNRVENTMHLRENMKGHFQAIEKAIKDNHINVVRYTESGEIESYDQFISLYNLAVKNPEVKFYLYTKNYKVLRCFFDFRVLPDNMVVLISIWGDHGIAAWEEFKKYHNVKCFAVNSDIDTPYTCPAYRKDNTGKVYRVKKESVKCGNCKLCFDSRAKVIKCFEH